MIYLLDTNVWITVSRQPKSTLAAHFIAVSPPDIRTCSIVVAELRHGCLRSAKPSASRAVVDALLAPYTSLPFDDPAEQAGLMIGPYDAQIAAIALANSCTLVTHNTGEFSPGSRARCRGLANPMNNARCRFDSDTPPIDHSISTGGGNGGCG
jgi:tRNA(fMet)-specific endonuclease VapC